MLRIGKNVSVSLRRKVNVFQSEQRAQSSSQQSSGKGIGKGVVVAAGVTTILSGLAGYSAWSHENRKFIQETIPGSEYLLEPILGPLVAPKPQKPNDSPKVSNSTVKKRPEIVQPKSDDSSKQAPLPTLPPSPPPTAPPKPLPKATKEELKTELPSQKEKDPVTDEQLSSAKPSGPSENEVLSTRIEAIVREAQSLVSASLLSSEQAVKTVRSHAEKAYAAIDSGEGHEKLYAIAAEVAKAKKEIIKSTEDKLEAARKKVEDLHEAVVKGRLDAATKENSSLSVAEEAISELNYSISRIQSSLSEALRDSSVVNEFRDLVEASWTQFEAEVRSLLPDVKIGEKSDKLTTDELNLLLVHAHRKVLALQKALAKQQTVDKERFKESVLRQREMDSKFVDGKMNAELERQRRDLALENRRRLQQLRDDLESEMRVQLKRQAAAHSDHLADVLDQQEYKLEEKWQSKLKDELQKESDKYYQSLSRIQGELEGLKMGLKSRADADNAAHSAHELWLACESLKMALRFGKENSRSWEEQLMPLDGYVKSIKNCSDENDPFVKSVLSTVPRVALERGVLTDEALKERFLKVDRVCRRVALVGENGASLPRYLLSYLQSFFLVGAFDRIPESEIRDEEIDASKLNTHDLLARARYCLAKDDILQAVRYLNLLRGEPRNVASDWIREARCSLEAKQAADALMAYAAATGARAL